MTAQAVRRATYQDILDAPAGHVAQIVFGVLHTHPRPAFAHASTSTSLTYFLCGPFHFGHGGPGGWIILDEPELHLGAAPDILVSDLAGWRRDRDELPERDSVFTTIAPDWVCEVLSPSTQVLDRAEKMEVYRREGVHHVWLIDPQAQTHEVYRRGDDAWTRVDIHHGDVAVRAEPFDAVELPLGRLWEL